MGDSRGVLVKVVLFKAAPAYPSLLRITFVVVVIEPLFKNGHCIVETVLSSHVEFVESYQILSSPVEILSNTIESCQILLNSIKSCLILSNPVEFCQILSNIVNSCQILSNFVYYCWILSNPFLSNIVKFYQILSNLVKFCKVFILLNPVNFVKSCLILSNPVKFCQIRSNFVKSCPVLSSPINSCQFSPIFSNLSKTVQPAQPFWTVFTVLLFLHGTWSLWILPKQ